MGKMPEALREEQRESGNRGNGKGFTKDPRFRKTLLHIYG